MWNCSLPLPISPFKNGQPPLATGAQLIMTQSRSSFSKKTPRSTIRLTAFCPTSRRPLAQAPRPLPSRRRESTRRRRTPSSKVMSLITSTLTHLWWSRTTWLQLPVASWWTRVLYAPRTNRGCHSSSYSKMWSATDRAWDKRRTSALADKTAWLEWRLTKVLPLRSAARAVSKTSSLSSQKSLTLASSRGSPLSSREWSTRGLASPKSMGLTTREPSLLIAEGQV